MWHASVVDAKSIINAIETRGGARWFRNIHRTKQVGEPRHGRWVFRGLRQCCDWHAEREMIFLTVMPPGAFYR